MNDIKDWRGPQYCAKCGEPCLIEWRDQARYDTKTGKRVHIPFAVCPNASATAGAHADRTGAYHTVAELDRLTVGISRDTRG